MPTTIVTGSVTEAAEVLRRGGTVVFPSETVFGVGADAFNEEAVAAIYRAKQRPADNPMIVHVLDSSLVKKVAETVPELAERLLHEFAPGPITVVLPRHESLPALVSGGLPSVAVRIPSHPVARSLLEAFGGPVAAPSANIAGRPSPTSWEAALAELDGRVDCVLTGSPSTLGLESTVVDCLGDLPIVLRHGFVTIEQIAAALDLDPQEVIRASERSDGEGSPGTRHPHYVPRARVVLVDPEIGLPRSKEIGPQAAFIGLAPAPHAFRYRVVRLYQNVDEYSAGLYAFFLMCESFGIDEIHCQVVPEAGVGRALMDRLRRAADERG